MEKTNKKLTMVSILLAVIITAIGVSFGYFIWNSTTNTDISFTVEGAVVELSDGSDITGANLMPVSSYTNGGKNVVKKDIKIKLKNNVTSNVTVNFKLKINSIDSGLNHNSFKYNLVNASGTSVKSGNFSTSKAGDSISLYTLSTENNTLTTSISSYILYIYIDGAMGDNPSTMMNQSFDFSFVVDSTGSMLERIGNATTVISDLDIGSDGNEGSGVYKIEHNAILANSSATGKEIPAVTDYRYYGPSPDNYICLDMEGQSTCPDRGLYRIIGSIYEENAGQNLVKVIKATTLTNGNTKTYAWDSGNNNIWATITNGTYSNNQISGSNVMKLLNSGDWWKGTNNYLNYSLTEKSKSKVNVSRFYLGGDNSSPNTQAIYEYERGTKKYNNDRPLYWDGYVGLMYPSDYGYAAGITCATETSLGSYSSSCKLKDWLFNSSNWQWFMTPNSNDPSFVWVLYSTGSVYNNLNINTTGGVTPVFYLSPTTSIKSGKGTYTAPYILS